MKAVFLDKASLFPADLDLDYLNSSTDHWTFYHATAPDQTIEHMNNAEIVVSNKVVINAAAMDANPALKLIVVAATGTNNIDLAAAGERGIQVSNIRGYGSATVAQHTFALLLALTNQILPYTRDVQNGRWATSDNFCLMDYPIVELAGKHLVIVGRGETGLAVAKLARAFDMQVSFAASLSGAQDGRLALHELLPLADVLSIHCLLSEQTRNLIGLQQLRQMKPGAFLLNTARGGIVNEDDLLTALQQGLIAGAALDLLTTEPPRQSHPLIDANLPNLIITPHCAWGSREARQRLTDQVADIIRSFLAGTAVNRVV